VFLFQSCNEANLLQSVNKPITNYVGFPLLLSCCMQVQERDPRSYQIYLQLPDGTCFLGSTPEQLYIRSGSHVASEAVAATRPRGPAGRPASEPVTPACLCMSKMYLHLLRSPDHGDAYALLKQHDGCGVQHRRRDALQRLLQRVSGLRKWLLLQA